MFNGFIKNTGKSNLAGDSTGRSVYWRIINSASYASSYALEIKAGESFVGKKFRGNLWRFLEPKDGDKFESNSEGNTAYLRFCENVGKECPKETKSIDGQDVEVQLLPTLSTEEFLGQPVIAFVDKGRPFKNKEGETKQYFDCKFCKKWDGGKKKVIAGGKKDDIPF